MKKTILSILALLLLCACKNEDVVWVDTKAGKSDDFELSQKVATETLGVLVFKTNNVSRSELEENCKQNTFRNYMACVYFYKRSVPPDIKGMPPVAALDLLKSKNYVAVVRHFKDTQRLTTEYRKQSIPLKKGE